MLRQFYARRYNNSNAIHSEFENVVRYLNAAERGGKALSELTAKLFDTDGEIAPFVEFIFDPMTGLRYRIKGGDWITMAQADTLRGAPGQSFGGSSVGLIPSVGYLDGNGAILFNRLAIPDGAIPQVKISGFADALATAVGLPHVGPTPPVDNRRMWVNTNGASPSLNYSDGVDWITVEGVQLPAVGSGTGAANKVLRVNGAGSGYELVDVPGLGFVASSQVGAGGGVAGLSTTKTVPVRQLPRVGKRITMRIDLTSNAAVNRVVGFLPTRAQAIAEGSAEGVSARVVAVTGTGAGGNYSARLRIGTNASTASLPIFGISTGVLMAAGTVTSTSTGYEDTVPILTDTPVAVAIETFSVSGGLTAGMVEVVFELI